MCFCIGSVLFYFAVYRTLMEAFYSLALFHLDTNHSFLFVCMDDRPKQQHSSYSIKESEIVFLFEQQIINKLFSKYSVSSLGIGKAVLLESSRPSIVGIDYIQSNRHALEVITTESQQLPVYMHDSAGRIMQPEQTCVYSSMPYVISRCNPDGLRTDFDMDLCRGKHSVSTCAC